MPMATALRAMGVYRPRGAACGYALLHDHEAFSPPPTNFLHLDQLKLGVKAVGGAVRRSAACACRSRARTGGWRCCQALGSVRLWVARTDWRLSGARWRASVRRTHRFVAGIVCRAVSRAVSGEVAGRGASGEVAGRGASGEVAGRGASGVA